MAEMTERQARDWPAAIAEAQDYVDGTIDPDLRSHYWTVTWEEETRPGRGHLLDALWLDGEHLVQIRMDVYGAPMVSVAEMGWLHSSADEGCDCGRPRCTERWS